jgi:transposase-like protein
MKTFKSMIMQDNRPVEDGMDLALVYADANRETLLQFIEEKTQALEHVREKLAALRRKWAFLPGAIIAAVSAALLFVNIILGIFGIVGGIGFAIFAEVKKKKDIEKLEMEEQNIDAREAPNGVTHIGKMYYLVDVIPFEDGKMVVDTSGIQERTKFVYPGIPQAVNRLKEIVEIMERLSEDLPVLLPPTSKAGTREEDSLTGIEEEMAHILTLNRQLLEEKIDATAEVPAFTSTSDVVHSLHLLSEYLEEGKPGIIISQPEESVEQSLKSLQAIHENAKEIEKQGGDNDENIMQNVRDQMDTQINRTKRARDYSLIEVLGKNLDQLKPLYDYPLTRFYCPKCHKVPEYAAKTAPVPIAELNERPIDQLKEFYKSTEMVQFRKLVDNIRRHLDQAGKDGEDLSSEHYRVLESKLVSYEKNIRELALEIEGIDPKAEVHSRNAVLKYNTLHHHWKCQLCGETFTGEEAQWARILKIKDDLILPVWDKLWLEKHDESMRIIREKEAELRKNRELESKQLREEADVFTQEYREVRNQLEEANAEYQASHQQFQMMCDFFERRGILSAETVASMRNDITGNTDAGPASEKIIEVSDQMENQLEQEPETVFLRRGELVDYTEETRNTHKYFKSTVQELLMIEEEIQGEEKEQQEYQEQQEQQEVANV